MSEETELMRISWGPQHPMSGQFRLILETDGERVTKIIPDLGFTHRGIEKILEFRNFVQGIVPIERLSMLDAANFNLAYVRAVEELADIEVPERAKYIRTILCEISRINSHLYAFGLVAEAAGGYPAVFLWTVADREPLLDLAEMLTGARWSYSFFVPGGVRADIPKGFKERCLETLRYLENRIAKYKECWLDNKVFKARTVGVAYLSPKDAIRLGAVGPNLRSSGVPMDLRKDEPYEAYGEVDFEMVVLKEGDCYARLLARYLEIVESIKIIRQAVQNMPEGPIISLPKPMKKKTETLQDLLRLAAVGRFTVPKGEAFARVESARAEVDVHMITDGSAKPYRVKIISPTFRNLYVLSRLPEIEHIRVADVPVILYSFDPWYLDADR